MNPTVAVLLHSLSLSRRLMLDSVRDLSAAELSRISYPADRSCARLLGMAAAADREILRLLDNTDLPDVPAGFEARFARWGTGDDGETREYDSTLPDIFASQRDALLQATGSLEPSRLDETLEPPDHLDEEGFFRFERVGEMILAAATYTSYLVGEASAVRTALEKAPLDDPIDGTMATMETRSAPPGGTGSRVAEGDR